MGKFKKLLEGESIKRGELEEQIVNDVLNYLLIFGNNGKLSPNITVPKDYLILSNLNSPLNITFDLDQDAEKEIKKAVLQNYKELKNNKKDIVKNDLLNIHIKKYKDEFKDFKNDLIAQKNKLEKSSLKNLYYCYNTGEIQLTNIYKDIDLTRSKTDCFIVKSSKIDIFYTANDTKAYLGPDLNTIQNKLLLSSVKNYSSGFQLEILSKNIVSEYVLKYVPLTNYKNNEFKKIIDTEFKNFYVYLEEFRNKFTENLQDQSVRTKYFEKVKEIAFKNYKDTLKKDLNNIIKFLENPKEKKTDFLNKLFKLSNKSFNTNLKTNFINEILEKLYNINKNFDKLKINDFIFLLLILEVYNEKEYNNFMRNFRNEEILTLIDSKKIIEAYNLLLKNIFKNTIQKNEFLKEVKKCIVNEALTGVARIEGVKSNDINKYNYIYNIKKLETFGSPTFLIEVKDNGSNKILSIKKINDNILEEYTKLVNINVFYFRNAFAMRLNISRNKINELNSLKLSNTPTFSYIINESIDSIKNIYNIDSSDEFFNYIKDKLEDILKNIFQKIYDFFVYTVDNIKDFVKIFETKLINSQNIIEFLNEFSKYSDSKIEIKYSINGEEDTLKIENTTNNFAFEIKTDSELQENTLPNMHSYNITPTGDIAQSGIFSIDFPSVQYSSTDSKKENNKPMEKLNFEAGLKIGDYVEGIEINSEKKRKGKITFIGYNDNKTIDFVIILGNDNKKYVLISGEKIEKNDNK